MYKGYYVFERKIFSNSGEQTVIDIVFCPDDGSNDDEVDYRLSLGQYLIAPTGVEPIWRQEAGY